MTAVTNIWAYLVGGSARVIVGVDTQKAQSVAPLAKLLIYMKRHVPPPGRLPVAGSKDLCYMTADFTCRATGRAG